MKTAARRRYFINRRMQLGLTLSLAGMAAATAIVYAAISYNAAYHRIEAIQNRAHIPYVTTWEAARPAVLWGAGMAFTAIVLAGAFSSALAARRAAEISRDFLPLFESIGAGTPEAPPADALSSGSELAAAYVEFLRAFDQKNARTADFLKQVENSLAYMQMHPDTAGLLMQQIDEDASALLAAFEDNSTTD